ncbi:hypothetical protein [Haloarchaeobius litoreus]|uniref:Sensor histidine kinase n=1 Tax=Haloarchaeobius litoreus TaxID=755306 RepID=A0ABD6DFU2_9EURY|nr:hypothetical protein [Haloarchaeobius litoreus]
MRGPLTALWNTRLLGTSLRLLVGFLVAGALAVAGAVVALRVGGALGILTLSTLVLVGLTLVRIGLVFANG